MEAETSGSRSTTSARSSSLVSQSFNGPIVYFDHYHQLLEKDITICAVQ